MKLDVISIIYYFVDKTKCFILILFIIFDQIIIKFISEINLLLLLQKMILYACLYDICSDNIFSKCAVNNFVNSLNIIFGIFELVSLVYFHNYFGLKISF